MKNIFVVNGYQGSGKDAFVNFCVDILEERKIECYSISSVDKIKEAALLIGWSGHKSNNDRNGLSDLKDLAAKYWDGPFLEMKSWIDFLDDGDYIFFMIREPKEIQRMVEEYPQTKTICVERYVENIATNHADQNIENYKYDYYINNFSTLDVLETMARNFLDMVK